MAFFEDVDDFFRYEFSANSSEVEFEFANGTISMAFPKDFFASIPEIHQYFNAYDAINHMDARQLEELRGLIAPDITRLNLELEEENRTINRSKFEQMNTFRQEVRSLNKKHEEVVETLKEKINSTQVTVNKKTEEITEYKKTISELTRNNEDLNRQIERMQNQRQQSYKDAYDSWADFDEYKRREIEMYHRRGIGPNGEVYRY